MTIFLEKAMPFDLRTLRSFRCLRPLKMVSKVPSKLNDQLKTRHGYDQRLEALLRFIGL